MPDLEKSEKVVGATLLGYPMFSAIAWVLDTYARVELLVRLHDHLPTWMFNPLVGFLYMICGLALLYRSNQQQWKRMREKSKLFDHTGKTIEPRSKVAWLKPVAIVFSIAVVTVPMVAIAYSLNSQNDPPLLQMQPKPPSFAFVKTVAENRRDPVTSHNPQSPPQTHINGMIVEGGPGLYIDTAKGAVIEDVLAIGGAGVRIGDASKATLKGIKLFC